MMALSRLCQKQNSSGILRLRARSLKYLMSDLCSCALLLSNKRSSYPSPPPKPLSLYHSVLFNASLCSAELACHLSHQAPVCPDEPAAPSPTLRRNSPSSWLVISGLWKARVMEGRPHSLCLKGAHLQASQVTQESRAA